MPEETKKIYGGLCHQLPILVRTCGLCQTLAFHEDKASKDTARSKAHKLLLKHIAATLDIKDATEKDLAETILAKTIQEADVADYMYYTRRVLASWTYFKRFAVSILKVENANLADDEPQGEK